MISRVLDLAVQWTPQAAISQSGAAPSISGNLSKKTKLVAAKDAPKASQPKAAASTVPADVAAAAPIVLPLVLNLQLPAQVAASSGPAARVRPQTTGAASGEGTPDVPDTTHDASKTEAADFVAPAPLPTIAFQARVNQASVSQPTDVVSLSETPAPSVKAAASAATSSGINVKVPDEPDQPAPAATPATAPLQAKTTTASAKESASADATIPPASNDSAPFNGVPPVHFAVAAAGDHSSTHTTPDSAQSAEPAPEPRDAAQYESAQASSVSPSGTSPSSVQPLREVTLHVTSDSQKVDVQLSDRRGELQVVVKSGDPGLTNDLRSGLDELVGGLEKSGFRAEAWRPDDTPRHNFQPVAGASRGSGTGEQSDQQPGQDPREQGRNSYAAEYVPRRKSRGGNADWTNQISSLMGAEKEN
jgi:hypothetical protein